MQKNRINEQRYSTIESISFDTQSHAFKSEKKAAIVAPVAFILFVQFIRIQ